MNSILHCPAISSFLRSAASTRHIHRSQSNRHRPNTQLRPSRRHYNHLSQSLLLRPKKWCCCQCGRAIQTSFPTRQSLPKPTRMMSISDPFYPLVLLNAPRSSRKLNRLFALVDAVKSGAVWRIWISLFSVTRVTSLARRVVWCRHPRLGRRLRRRSGGSGGDGGCIIRVRGRWFAPAGGLPLWLLFLGSARLDFCCLWVDQSECTGRRSVPKNTRYTTIQQDGCSSWERRPHRA